MSKQEIRKMKTTLKKKIKVGENLTEHEMDLCEEWNIKYQKNGKCHFLKIAYFNRIYIYARVLA